MTGYTKVFNSILTSTIWQEDAETKVVWVTLLALADVNGTVDATIPGLAHVAKIPIEKTEAAIKKFLSPDPYSRTKKDEGRRLMEIEGGWLLINHAAYRRKRDPGERREYLRKKQAERREKLKCQQMSTNVNKCQQMLSQAEAEAEGEEEAEEDTTSFRKKESSLALSASRFADKLEKLIPPKSESDRTALFHATLWLKSQIQDGRQGEGVFEEVLKIAREAKSAKKPIAILFYRLRQELGYNPKAEAQKRK